MPKPSPASTVLVESLLPLTEHGYDVTPGVAQRSDALQRVVLITRSPARGTRRVDFIVEFYLGLPGLTCVSNSAIPYAFVADRWTAVGDGAWRVLRAGEDPQPLIEALAGDVEAGRRNFLDRWADVDAVAAEVLDGAGEVGDVSQTGGLRLLSLWFAHRRDDRLADVMLRLEQRGAVDEKLLELQATVQQ